MKNKTTKRALLASALSLLLCCAMLIGTTFAWFTDSVSSNGNKIVAGTLDISLHKMEKSGAWTDISDKTDPLFDYALWEPGYTAVQLLKVQNDGNLALKWNAALTHTGDISILADVIDVYVTTEELTAYPTGRDVVLGWTKAGSLREFIDGFITKTKGELNATDSKVAYLGIALHMQESAGNKYQGLDLGGTFDIKILATQNTVEEDSFDNQYDAGAYNGIVFNAAQMKSALEQGGKIVATGNFNADGAFVVPWNTNRKTEYLIDAAKVESISGGEYVLDDAANWGMTVEVSDGETLSFSDMDITADSSWVMNIKNEGGDVLIKDVNIAANQGAAIYAYGKGGTTVLENISGNNTDLSDENAANSPWAATAVAASNGQNMIINSGTYIGTSTGIFLYSSGGNITINGGTFKAPNVIIADIHGNVSSVVTINGGNFDGKIQTQCNSGSCPNGPAVIYINGGNFTNFSDNGYSNIKISGGTFDVAPASRMIADGYSVIENADGTYSVGIVYDTTFVGGLYEYLPTLKSGDTLVLPAGTYTTSGTLPVPAGVTIKGANGAEVIIHQTSAGQDNIFACAGDATFENITFESNRKGYAIADNTKNHDTDGNITVVNCKFKGIAAEKNYGIYKNLNGNLTVKDCTFDNYNNALCGIVNGNGSTTVITGCTFTQINVEAIGYVKDSMPENFEAEVIANNTGLTAENVIGY